MMGAGHLLFAAITTTCIFVGIAFEERDLITAFGDRYRKYRRQVSMIVTFLGRAAPEHEKMRQSS